MARKQSVKSLIAKHRAMPAAPAVGRRTVARDGLQNILTGMGGDKDKLFNTFFGMTEMAKEQQDAAYRGDWIARKGIDIPAFDSTREWRTWQADPDDVALIEETEKNFQVQLKVMKAMTLGRLYGGGAIIIGCNTGNPEEELIPEQVQEGDLKFLHVVNRWELSAGDMEWDVQSPWYGVPKWFTPNSRDGSITAQNMKLHPSRVVRFTGNMIPDVGLAQGWGDSVLMALVDAVKSAGLTSASIAQMVAESKLDVIKIPGLSESITSTEYEEALKSRFSFANIAKSVFGILLLDKEEEWERINQSFQSMPDIEKIKLMIASAAFDIPATRFLSQSPQGLSSTGESDTRNFYDRLSVEQNVFLTPALRNLDNVILRSSLGNVPPDEARDMWYSWRPLWQPTAKEKAEIAASKAQTFKVDVDAGLINEVVLKKAREAQLIEDETYPGLQQIIDDFDDDPELEEAKAAEEELQAQLTGGQDPNEPGATNDPKQIGQKAQPQKALPPPTKNKSAVDGIVSRLADASRPRSLYVRRDLVNVGDVEKWARDQGFKSVIPDMHVTVLYSKAPVDWLKIGADEYRSEPDGGLIVKAGGPRVIEMLGEGAICLCFANSDLQYRHRSMMYRGEEDGITWDFPDYTPHVTLTYEGGELNLEEIKPYTGELRFGPEIFEEIRGSYTPGPERTPGPRRTRDYNQNHDPETGQFSSGEGGGAGEGGRTELVRELSRSKTPVNKLKNEHQLTSQEVTYLQRLRKGRKEKPL